MGSRACFLFKQQRCPNLSELSSASARWEPQECRLRGSGGIVRPGHEILMMWGFLDPCFRSKKEKEEGAVREEEKEAEGNGGLELEEKGGASKPRESGELL